MNKIVAMVLQNCIQKKKPTEGICTCMYQGIIQNVLLGRGKYTAPFGGGGGGGSWDMFRDLVF